MYGLWTVKARRVNGYSIIDITTEDKAQALVDELNGMGFESVYYFKTKYKKGDAYGSKPKEKK